MNVVGIEVFVRWKWHPNEVDLVIVKQYTLCYLTFYYVCAYLCIYFIFGGQSTVAHFYAVIVTIAKWFIFSEEPEFLVVAQRDKISRISLDAENTIETLPVFGIRNVIAIDFDMRNNCLYWADIINDSIGVSIL